MVDKEKSGLPDAFQRTPPSASCHDTIPAVEYAAESTKAGTEWHRGAADGKRRPLVAAAGTRSNPGVQWCKGLSLSLRRERSLAFCKSAPNWDSPQKLPSLAGWQSCTCLSRGSLWHAVDSAKCSSLSRRSTC